MDVSEPEISSLRKSAESSMKRRESRKVQQRCRHFVFVNSASKGPRQHKMASIARQTAQKLTSAAAAPARCLSTSAIALAAKGKAGESGIFASPLPPSQMAFLCDMLHF